MLLTLLLIPLLGIFAISTTNIYTRESTINTLESTIISESTISTNYLRTLKVKNIALITSLINLFISLIIFILFDFSSNQFQFVQEYHEVSSFDFYLGLDGLSIYFVLLTTIITPIALLSN